MYFENFCSSLNKSSNMSFIWNKVRALSKGFAKNENANEYNPDAKKAVNKAIDDLCPPWVETHPPDFSSLDYDELFEQPFMIDEFETVLYNAKPKSCPGLDGIDYYLINKIPSDYKHLLLELLNKIYFSGDIPSEWHEFLIFFIPKKDKNKYRPISLAQVPLKILEKMLYMRLVWWVEHNNILPTTQYGFRKDSSCNDNIAILASHINLHFLKNEDTAALFLDIEGAFDNVLCDLLIEKLKSLKLSASAIRFIYHIIHSRNVTIHFDDIDCKRKCFKGLPQGSVLSPLLYAIYINKIDQAIPPDTDTKLICFADDTYIYNTDSDTEHAIDKLAISANILQDWLAHKGLHLSVKKTTFCVFSNSRLRSETSHQININNTLVESVKEVKFLGVIFHNNLTWSSHIKKIVSSSSRVLNLLKFLTNIWWGAAPDLLLLLLYTALVRSRMEYASFVWSNVPDKIFYPLQKVQNCGIRIAMGYRQSTPLNVIHAVAKIPPLRIRIAFLSENYLLRCIAKEDHPLIPILDETLELHNSMLVNKKDLSCLCEGYLKASELAYIVQTNLRPHVWEIDYIALTRTVNIFYTEGSTINASTNPSERFNQIFVQNDSISWYFTDESKKKDLPYAGFAIYHVNTDTIHMRRTSKHTTIFSCEAMAILTALQIAKEKDNHSYIQIFTDSKSVLDAILSKSYWKTKSYLILEIRKIIYILESIGGKKVELYWIPAHKGLAFNEKVDSAAKESIYSGIDTHLLLPKDDLTSHFKQNMFSDLYNWTLRAGTSPIEPKGAIYCNSFLNISNRKPWFIKMPLERRAVVSFNRLRANHTSLNESLYRKDITDSPFCSCSITEQSADHVFLGMS